MDGQSDIFDLLDDSPPAPPFTVYICVWSMRHECGWCGGKNIHGGGGMRNPEDDNEPWHYEYCEKCSTKYGHPRLVGAGLQISINRTQTPRPANLGPRITKEGG